VKVVIAGMDGYIGWPLSHYLRWRGHEVEGFDCFLRRQMVRWAGGESVTPLRDWQEVPFCDLRLRRSGSPVQRFLEGADVVIHLAEQPSAPFSMKDMDSAATTANNNVVGTLNLLWAMQEVCPEAHLVKLGSMGEYGTPNVDILEGEAEMVFRGRHDRMIFPRRPGSFYHASKVADTYNVELACRAWGLRATDIMQGVVYGLGYEHQPEGKLGLTRFDVDPIFGTAINRFCAQAVAEVPITPYGKGGQTRGFLPLRDSLQCLGIAIENPPASGEYRTLNQFEQTYSIGELAQQVQVAAWYWGVASEVRHVENPRAEAEAHYYEPDHQRLFDLGYVPTRDMQLELRELIGVLREYRDRIDVEALLPDVHWSGERRRVEYLEA